MNKTCNNCLNSRLIISENGPHPICCLSNKKALECIVDINKPHFISRTIEPMKEDENGPR